MAIVPGTAGCAAGGAGSGGEESPEDAAEVRIRVENNIAIATVLTVAVVSEGGSRRLLGTIAPGERGSFRFRPVQTMLNYRLRATTTEGVEIVSPPFSVAGRAAVEWDPNANLLSFVVGGDP